MIVIKLLLCFSEILTEFLSSLIVAESLASFDSSLVAHVVILVKLVVVVCLIKVKLVRIDREVMAHEHLMRLRRLLGRCRLVRHHLRWWLLLHARTLALSIISLFVIFAGIWLLLHLHSLLCSFNLPIEM